MNSDTTPGVDITSRGYGETSAVAQSGTPADSDIALFDAAPTADDIRHKIIEQFEGFKPHMAAYGQYANTIAALSIEYHNARLRDVLGVTIGEGVLLLTLDARETPKSLDEKLAALHFDGPAVKQILFDRTKAAYYLFI